MVVSEKTPSVSGSVLQWVALRSQRKWYDAVRSIFHDFKYNPLNDSDGVVLQNAEFEFILSETDEKSSESVPKTFGSLHDLSKYIYNEGSNIAESLSRKYEYDIANMKRRNRSEFFVNTTSLESGREAFYYRLSSNNSSSARVANNNSVQKKDRFRRKSKNDECDKTADYDSERIEGTLRDRHAAMTLLVRRNCILFHNQLLSLIQWLVSASHRQKLMAFDSIRDLLLYALLPPDRPLYNIVDHPILRAACLAEQQKTNSTKNSSENFQKRRILRLRLSPQTILVLWFEEFLKVATANIFNTIFLHQKIETEVYRRKSYELAYAISSTRVEQRSGLVSFLIEGFSDNNKKMARSNEYFVKQFLINQPSWKEFVVDLVQDKIYKADNSKGGGSSDSKYHRMLQLLSSLKLSEKDAQSVHLKLSKIFFDFLEMIQSSNLFYSGGNSLSKCLLLNASEGKKNKLKKKIHSRKMLKLKKKSKSPITTLDPKQLLFECLFDTTKVNRLLAACLRGLSKVSRFVKFESADHSRLVDSLYLLVHISPNPRIRICSLQLLFGMLNLNGSMNDRYYRAYYETLRIFRIYNASNRHLLFNLLATLVKEDGVATRSVALLRRVVQSLTHQDTTAISIQALDIIRGAINNSPSLEDVLCLTDKELQEDMADDKLLQGDDLSADEKACHEKVKQKSIEDFCKPNLSTNDTHFDFLKREPKFSKSLAAYFWEVELWKSNICPDISQSASTLIGET